MSGEQLDAVVTGSVDVGEANRIVRLLTPTEGRVSLLARGARSSKRRLGGALEPGVVLRVRRTRGRGELATLGEVDVVQLPRVARADLLRIAQLAYGCELCAALAPEGGEAERLFRLLVTWLVLLEGEAAPGVASRVAFEGKALTFAGLTPQLVDCARCGERLDDPAVFDPEAGGGLHARCGGGRHVEVASLSACEALRRTPLAETPSRPAPADRWLLSDFARWQLGHDLRSRSLLADVEHEAGDGGRG